MATDALVLHLTVEGEPVPKARPRLGRNGHTYTPERTLTHEHWAVSCLLQQYPGLQPDGQHAFRVIVVYFLKSKRRIDLDNLLKCVPLDAFNGLVWADDSQVTEIQARVVRGSAWPRTEITVEQIA